MQTLYNLNNHAATLSVLPTMFPTPSAKFSLFIESAPDPSRTLSALLKQIDTPSTLLTGFQQNVQFPAFLLPRLGYLYPIIGMSTVGQSGGDSIQSWFDADPLLVISNVFTAVNYNVLRASYPQYPQIPPNVHFLGLSFTVMNPLSISVTHTLHLTTQRGIYGTITEFIGSWLGTPTFPLTVTIPAYSSMYIQLLATLTGSASSYVLYSAPPNYDATLITMYDENNNYVIPGVALNY